ncbi:hypothetical protein MMC25_005452 [Agyrium rufum]|nr:hypothetical protein [Agyrium rufum]
MKTLNPTKIPHRPLGKDGPLVPRMGIGLVNLSGGVYGPKMTDADRTAFLDTAYEMGDTAWDTADEYGDCEDILGRWFAANPEKRDKIFLSTKFGIKRTPEVPPRGVSACSTPEYCREAIEKSLKRLGLRYVDLYYVHRLDKVTPIEKTMEALVELKKAGKIRHVGLSEYSADSLRRAYAVHPVTCVQMEYSAFCLDIESPTTKFLETARELGVAIVAYCPLGHGFLTGTIRKRDDVLGEGDLRGMLPWLAEDNVQKNVSVVEKVTEIAKVKGISTAQLALAWVLAQGDDIFPIPGTTKIYRLEENLASCFVSLSSEEEKSVHFVAQDVIGGRVQTKLGHTYGDTPPL